MEETKYLELMAKYLSGNIALPERESLMRWAEKSEANRAFFDQMIQLWSISAGFKNDFDADVAAAWQVMDQKLERRKDDEGSSGKIVRLPYSRTMLRAAAVILLLLSVGYWWVFPSNAGKMVVQTALKEQKELQLPDGTTVWLNENTSFQYEDKKDQRIVNLAGEAFFKVVRMPEKPFVICSGDTKTTVLGTSFNLRAYPEENSIEVTVASGKVEFRDEDNENVKVLLETGNSGVYDKTKQAIIKTESGFLNAVSWKTHKLNFDQVDLSDVLPALERYFKVDIVVPNERILNCNFHGIYPDPILEDILGMMEYSMELEIEKTNGTILIHGEGCDK